MMNKNTCINSFSRLMLLSFFVCAGLPDLAYAAPAILGTPLVDGVISTVLYSGIGIAMAFAAYRVVDLLTPGHLGKEVTENKNVALAILVGSFVLGVCIIIAAAITG